MKKIKLETPIVTNCSPFSGGMYYYYDSGLAETQFEAFEQQLNIGSTYKDLKIRNVKPEDLKMAAEMFIYLNACPETPSLKHWFDTWHRFYTIVFATQSKDQIILTLNRFMKSIEHQNIFGRVSAQKLFKRASKLFSLKSTKIQDILPGMAADEATLNQTVQGLNTEGKSVAVIRQEFFTILPNTISYKQK